MIHLFKSAVARTLTYGLIAVIAGGLLIGAIRLALPFADLLRTPLEGLLAETLGLEVQVGRLGLRLAGWVPRLQLQDVQLVDPASGRTQLSLAQLRVDLDLLETARERAPKIESVTLVGAHLVVERLANGRVTVAGLKGFEGGNPEDMTFFLGNGRFLLADSDLYWIDEHAGTPPLHLADVRMQFVNLGQRHRIGISARLSEDAESRLRLTADLRGEPGNPTDWHGEVYQHWRLTDVGPALRGRISDALSVGSGAVEIESWSDWSGLALTRSLNRVAVDGLRVRDLRDGGRGEPAELDHLSGILQWRREDRGWRLQARDLLLSRNGARHSPTDLGFRFSPLAAGGWTLEGGVGALDLADLRGLLALVPEPLPAALAQAREMLIGGKLQDLRLRIRQQPRMPARWGVSGRLRELAFAPRGRLPGIRGLDAEVAADQSRGRVVLNARDLTLSRPDLTPEPIAIDALAGAVSWRRDDTGGLHIETPELVARNRDIATRSRLAIRIPAGGGSPFVDLHAEIRDVDASAIRRYLPRARLKKKLADWLDRAFVSGRIPSGALLFRGTAADFPFTEQQGRFEVLLDVEDVTLEYHRAWPRVESATGEVLFLNSGMDVSVHRARFLDSEIRAGSARIPDLRRAVAVEIDGTATGPLADGLRVLGETPLRARLGRLAEVFRAAGTSQLELAMAVPLTHKGRKGPLRLAGKLSLAKEASVAIAGGALELTELNGSLGFTERSLAARDLGARLWGVPLQIGIDTEDPAQSVGRRTRVSAAGRFSGSDLAQRFPSPIWDDLTGSTRLALDLAIDHPTGGQTAMPLDFTLQSNLQGITLNLPAPLGKQASQTRALRLSGRLAPDQDLRVRGALGALGIDLEFARGKNRAFRFTRGTLGLGQDRVRPPDGRGLRLGGAIGTLDLAAWLNWWADRETPGGGEAGPGAVLTSADLQVRHLLFGDMTGNDVRLRLERRSNRWEAQLSARELAGSVEVPHRPRREPIRVQLERLDLKGLLGQKGAEGQTLEPKRRPPDPRRAHTLDLQIENLLWGENPIGRVSLRSQPRPDGVEFTEIRLAGPLMSVRGSAHWTRNGDAQRTSLSVAGEGSDLGAFLRSLEYESLLHKAPATASLDLEWPGEPLRFTPAALRGRIELDVGAGSLLDVEPGVGRMLGILNIGALRRRLALDFSDVFDRGYAFEEIAGALDVGGGTATIKTLVIEGPSADISITGRTDLVKKEFDQVVTVTPRIGTGVAVAGAVAGGPLVGAAVLLADQVSGGAMDRLGRRQYRVTGPWEDPEFSRGADERQRQPLETEGPFAVGQGRAGAARSTEEKADEAKSADAAPSPAPKQRPPAFESRSDENLFLEGH